MLQLILRVAAYAVLGFAMFAATGMQSGRDPLVVAAAVFGAACWSGGVTTFLERVAYKKKDATERVAWGALGGALSVGGFAGALSLLAWGHIDVVLVPVGALLGGVMQAARAFSLGRFMPPDDRFEPEGEAPAEAAKDP